VAVESLALVAQGSLEALLAGRLIGVTRDDYEHSLDVAPPPPKPAPVPVKPEPRRRCTRWQVTTLGRPAGNSRRAISCTLGTARPCAMKRTLALTMNAGRCVQCGPVCILTSPVSQRGVRSRVVFQWRARVRVAPGGAAAQFRLVPGLGFAIEFSRIRPELSSADAQPASPYFAVDPILRAFLGIERSLGRWSLRGIVGVDFATRPVRYVVTYQSDTETVRTPWRVRPFGAIVLQWDCDYRKAS